MAKGSTLESLLDEAGIKEEVYAGATKRVLAWQITEAMREQKMGKTEMAAKLKTSRTQLNRLLDPENSKVQLDTIEKAAEAVGRRVRIELV